jgi:hypothetical protein
MTRSKRSPPPRTGRGANPPAAAATAGPGIDIHDDPSVDPSADRVVTRPDGYYWTAPDGRQLVGPFDSVVEAMADMDSGDAGGWTPGESLSEAEAEIGVSDWIDPDSGQLAEGQTTPHLNE